MAFQKCLEEKSTVADICRWMQTVVRRKISANSDWCQLSPEEILDACQKFFRTWTFMADRVLQNFQSQQYPSSNYDINTFSYQGLISL